MKHNFHIFTALLSEAFTEKDFFWFFKVQKLALSLTYVTKTACFPLSFFNAKFML